MRLLWVLAVFAVNYTNARVTFPHSTVLQAPDIAATNETSFTCQTQCTAFVDRKSDKLVITRDGNIIVTFTTIIGPNIYQPAGAHLSPGNYKLENIGQANPEFVFYVVQSDAPNFGTAVFVPQSTVGIMINGKERYATVLSSYDSVMFFSFEGRFPEGYPKIYSTGFDAAGMDGCTPSFEERVQNTPGQSSPQIVSAVVTIDFGFVGEHSADVAQKQGNTPKKGVGASTVYMSPGYVGCSFTAGQNYYHPLTRVEDSFSITANNVNWFTTFYDIPKEQPLYITVNNIKNSLVGTDIYSMSTNTDASFDVSVSWRSELPKSTFFLQFDFGDKSYTTKNPMKTTKPPTQGPLKTTTIATTNAPATTAKPATQDSHCNCAVDKFTWPVGWNPQEIWLDVVIILDTSESIGQESLRDACELVESLLDDQLTTDPTAPFYTRVGVIAMADTAKVLFSLNMTKNDNLNNVKVAKGVKNINLMDAFAQARQMLADGLLSSPDRANTKQVIYYITDSAATVNTVELDEFKQQGTIIVNHFFKEGEAEKPDLKELASSGYYYTDIEKNYMFTIQAFCKANCFCPSDLTVYNGNSDDIALIAAGGCYQARAAGIPFSKAVSACAETRNGLLASVHDAAKGEFINELITAVTNKAYYYWIGYSKGDDGQWKWEDKSTNPYTNWDKNEPSAAAISKCAYVDQSSRNLPWGAGNCQIGFPYACEYAPCSVGNKDC